MFQTINIVTPANGKKDRVEEMLKHLVGEVQKNEPDALEFQAIWDADAGAFNVIEKFASKEAQEYHRNQPYTAELRRISREEHNLAKKVEVHEVESFAGFVRHEN